MNHSNYFATTDEKLLKFLSFRCTFSCVSAPVPALLPLVSCRVAGHPLAQNERCLHMFLQDESVDKNYTPSKVRQA